MSKIAVAIIVTLLSLYTYLSIDSRINYKKSIITLIHKNDSLQSLILNRDSLVLNTLKELNKSDSLYINLYFDKQLLEKTIKNRNEKNNTYIRNLGIDGNIEFLTKYLYEKTCYQ